MGLAEDRSMNSRSAGAPESGSQSIEAGVELFLNFHGRIIEHLGLQMYQSPTAALAELVSNAWDADAEVVEIDLPDEIAPGATIVLRDNGSGMTLEEVRAQYLKVGLNRRGNDPTQRSSVLGRAVLGRKGIGKFAGFGIARRIRVETVSRDTGERTTFELDYERIRGESEEYVNQAPLAIPGATYEGPDAERAAHHGTSVILTDLVISRRPPSEQMRKSMSRRFSLGSSISNFEITIDGEAVSPDADAEGIQFSFPRDYEPSEKPPLLTSVDGEWGLEELPDGNVIRWRYRFYESTINEAELAGVAVFTSGKVAQMPFLFNLAGGLGGQHGTAYMAGRVEGDYLDALSRDIISPERQRIDWDAPEAAGLLAWGQERTQGLLRLWKARRGERRRRRLAERLAPLETELLQMGEHERRPLRRVLDNLAMIESIDDAQFVTMSESLVTAWKAGRLKDLIMQIGDSDVLDEVQMLQILLEANIVTDLQMAEVVKTKIGIVHELRKRIEGREVEDSLRNYIAEHPFLISPKWDTFRRETRVNTILADAASASGIDVDPGFAGRIDLALSSGDTMLVLEFMRPGLTLDIDHIQRFQRYIAEIKPALASNNALGLSRVIGYVIADNANRRAAVNQMIEDMSRNGQEVLTWSTLLDMAETAWREQMEILAQRSASDERIRELASS